MKVLVLEAQALHVGYLGCYGAERVDTQALDQLAAEGIVFDQHLADCPGAVIPTSWSGRYVLPSPPATPGTSDNLLFSQLQGSGVALHLVRETDLDPLPGDALTQRYVAVLEAALAALEQMAEREHGLVWVELPSLAPPWRFTAEELERFFPSSADSDETTQPWLDPPTGPLGPLEEEEFARLAATYSAAVSLADAELGAFREALEQQGWLDQVVLWYTARTGLALGEHDLVGADVALLREEMIHLPLLVRLPHQEHAGRRVSALTQPLDLVPTLLKSFGLPVPAELHGHSLWPLLQGEADKVRDYACAGVRQGERMEWMLRTPDWAFFSQIPIPPREEPGRTLLFRKPEDRWEVNNLVQHHPTWAEHLEQTLRGFVAATTQPGPLQPPVLQDVENVL